MLFNFNRVIWVILFVIGLFTLSVRDSYALLCGCFCVGPPEYPTVRCRAYECSNCDDWNTCWGIKDVPSGTECDDGSSSSCFFPGTEVSTPDGSVNIEDIKPGNIVDSFEPMTEEITTSTVASLYSVERDHYYVMTTESGNEVKVTDEHPFYIGEENTPKSLKDKIKNVFIMGIIYFKDGINIIKQSL